MPDTRTVSLIIYMPESVKKAIRRASGIVGMSMSDYARCRLSQAAKADEDKFVTSKTEATAVSGKQ